jgi:hypothetical protein
VLIVNDVFLTIFSGGVKVSDGMTMRQRVSLKYRTSRVLRVHSAGVGQSRGRNRDNCNSEFEYFSVFL